MHHDFLPKTLDIIHSGYLKRMYEMAGIDTTDRNISNHSGKVTLCTELFNQGFDDQLIRARSDHRPNYFNNTKYLHKICWNRWDAVHNRGPVLVLLRLNNLVQSLTFPTYLVIYFIMLLLLLCLIIEDYIIYWMFGLINLICMQIY